MSTILQCQSEDDLQRMLQDSAVRPVVLLKHSTACPISRSAKREFDQFAANTEDVDCWVVLVIEQRPLSQLIARDAGVVHQSPQAILFINGRPVWNASHGRITEFALRQAISDAHPA